MAVAPERLLRHRAARREFEDIARTLERRAADHDHAREIQDGVVQSLVLARYLLQSDRPGATEAVDDALASAKHIVTRGLGDEVEPGDLRLGGPGDLR